MTPGGRPRAERPRKPRFTLHLTDEEFADLDEAVALDRGKRAEWTRDAVMATVRRRLRAAARRPSEPPATPTDDD